MLADALRALRGARMTDEDGKPVTIELEPPATAAEIAAAEAKLPSPLPAEIREALLVTKGIVNGPLESFYLMDLEGIGLEEIFPSAWSIGHDGFGNYWVLDMLPGQTAWGPVWYACHDPAVIAWQAGSVEEFLTGTMAMFRPGAASPVDQVHETVSHTIWRDDPHARPRDEVLRGADPDLRRFAESVPADSVISDLRGASLGAGFSWGRFGPRSVVHRFGTEPVWAVSPPEKRPGLFSRLFGR